MLEDTRENSEMNERITVLERRIRDLEALVKGLTNELLDLKSVTLRLGKTYDDRENKHKRPYESPQSIDPGTQGTVILPRTRPQASRETIKEKKEIEPEMAMIMGPDGTLRPEERPASSDYIIASAKFRKKGEEDRRSKGENEKNPMIIIADEDDLKEKGK